MQFVNYITLFQMAAVCCLYIGVQLLNSCGKQSLSGLLTSLPTTSCLVILFSYDPIHSTATLRQAISCATGFVPGVAFAITFLFLIRKGEKINSAFLISALFCVIAAAVQYSASVEVQQLWKHFC